MNPAMLFSIGFVSTFITGGLTGIILGDSALDINVHDTYFVVAHFHLVMGISALYGMFAGIYHWFPKMFGRMLNKNLGYLHFWVTAICAYGVFFPMHFIGLAGMPRRYADYAVQFADWNLIASIGGFWFGLSQLLLVWILWDNCIRKKGEEVDDQVWEGAEGLEWTVPSPAPFHTFDEPPVVK